MLEALPIPHVAGTARHRRYMMALRSGADDRRSRRELRHRRAETLKGISTSERLSSGFIFIS